MLLICCLGLLFVMLCLSLKTLVQLKSNVQIGEAVNVKMKGEMRNHMEEGEDQEQEMRKFCSEY